MFVWSLPVPTVECCNIFLRQNSGGREGTPATLATLVVLVWPECRLSTPRHLHQPPRTPHHISADCQYSSHQPCHWPIPVRQKLQNQLISRPMGDAPPVFPPIGSLWPLSSARTSIINLGPQEKREVVFCVWFYQMISRHWNVQPKNDCNKIIYSTLGRLKE